jgi:hypothetical protein
MNKALLMVAALIGCAAVLAVISSKPSEEPPSTDWSIVRTRNEAAITLTYVTVSDAVPVELRSKVLKAASNELCSRRTHGNICVVGFYLPGDKVPVTTALDFSGTDPIAVWWGNEASGTKSFTKWDCLRAGEVGAPENALCGRGVKEAFDAVLSLAARTGIGEFCRWPNRPDVAADTTEVLGFAESLGRADSFKSQFDTSRASGRVIGETNRGYDCQKYLPIVDEMVRRSMYDWRLAMKTKQSS